MKQTESFENLADAITEPTISDRIEVQINSFLGFMWLLITGYWFDYLLNSFRRK